ncbi:NHL repeat-containing protein [Streptomyces murinus]|uniref:NHL repeat-containing protein n=1 Tax=Streptomyces murinus TaxID=33900 RepID=UPI003819453E
MVNEEPQTFILTPKENTPGAEGKISIFVESGKVNPPTDFAFDKNTQTFSWGAPEDINETTVYELTYMSATNPRFQPNIPNLSTPILADLKESKYSVTVRTTQNDNYSKASSCCFIIKPATIPIVTSGLNYPYGVAADSDTLYITNTGGNNVVKVSKNGGTPTTIVDSITDTTGVAVDNENLYIGKSASVVKVSKNGGTLIHTFDTGIRDPYGMAVDNENLYIANHTNRNVVKVSKSGGTPTTIVTGITPWGLAVDGEILYIATGDDTVVKVSKNGGTPTPLVTDITPRGLAVDGESLYIATRDDTVVKVSKNGGTPTPLVTADINPFGVAVDSDTLYILNNSKNSVVKRSKVLWDVVLPDGAGQD